MSVRIENCACESKSGLNDQYALWTCCRTFLSSPLNWIMTMEKKALSRKMIKKLLKILRANNCRKLKQCSKLFNWQIWTLGSLLRVESFSPSANRIALSRGSHILSHLHLSLMLLLLLLSGSSFTIYDIVHLEGEFKSTRQREKGIVLIRFSEWKIFQKII